MARLDTGNTYYLFSHNGNTGVKKYKDKQIILYLRVVMTWSMVLIVHMVVLFPLLIHSFFVLL